MEAIATIIAPVFVVILLGYGLGHTRLFGERDAAVLIGFVWYVAIPALLFRALAPQEMPSVDELLIVVAYYLCLYGIYAVSLVVAALFGQTPEERPVFAFVVSFGNGGFLGVPLLDATYGPEGVRMLLIILSFHTATLLPISTILLERARSSASGSDIFKKTFQQVRQNPIIISLLVGLGWAALGLPFPVWLDKIVALPAAAAAPVGLFAAGLSMTGVKIAGDIKQSMTMVFLKLVALPALVFAVTRYGFGLPDVWVGTATLTAALPTGMVPYSFATKYGVAPRRAASAMLISTGGAVITLSAVLILLGVGR